MHLMNDFNISIIGYGNIGRKRHQGIQNLKQKKIKVLKIFDNKFKKKLKVQSQIYKDSFEKFNFDKIDLIIISTPTVITEKIINNFIGKNNILVEKPLSRNANFIKKLVNIQNKKKKLIKTGYNLRFDDGVLLAKKIFDSKKLGKIYYVKNTYANGAAKTNTNKVGSILDMASHSINLIEYFFKNKKIKLNYSKIQKNEFLNKTKVDNGFISFNIDKIIGVIHHGFCNWKNQFELEIYGSKGFLKISSLSKWGNQSVTYGKRVYPSGTPKMKTWKFKKDNSWKNELNFIIKKIQNKKNKFNEINLEGYNTLQLINKLKNVI